MATLITMPQLGLTMNAGTVASWLKREGEAVEKGEPIAELLSDKSTVELEARASGTLLAILAEENENVECGKPLCVIGAPGEDIAALLAGTDRPAPAAETPLPAAPQPEQPSQPGRPTPTRPDGGERIFASPAARKYAREHGVDLAGVSGSGPGGRIVEKDVIQAATAGGPRATPAAARAAERLGVGLPSPAGERVRLEEVESLAKPRSIPLDEMRKTIARRMAESKRDIPHFYLAAEVDCLNLKNLRAKLAPAVERRYQSRLSYNDLIVKAAALALERHPGVNASFGGDEILLHPEANIGVAVGVKGGLLVPVVRRAAGKSPGEISRELAALVKLARSRRLPPDACGCGTCTVTNLGMYGISSFQAIVNPPESVIMALGAMTDRVVARAGEVVVRPMMNITLSCDHRVVNGVEGAEFLDCLCRLLENPEEMLV